VYTVHFCNCVLYKLSSWHISGSHNTCTPLPSEASTWF